VDGRPRGSSDGSTMRLSLFSALGMMRDGSGSARAGMTVGRSALYLMDGGGILSRGLYGRLRETESLLEGHGSY